ncbi:MAG: SHOCT domain-containing protein [Ignavibacteriae bacterium]|nr:SHOCT domain-containing protein [Ignavibacteriota bacterium]
MGNIPSEENALEILKKRFAKGEINKEQYESMKKELE